MAKWLEDLGHKFHKFVCTGPCCGEPRRLTRAELKAKLFYPKSRVNQHDQQHRDSQSNTTDHR